MSVIEDFIPTCSGALGVHESLGKNYDLTDLLGNTKDKPKDKEKWGIY